MAYRSTLTTIKSEVIECGALEFAFGTRTKEASGRGKDLADNSMFGKVFFIINLLRRVSASTTFC